MADLVVQTGRSWGESAGAVSVGTHLVVNGGDPAGLFRGAIMVCPLQAFGCLFIDGFWRRTLVLPLLPLTSPRARATTMS